MYFNFTTYTALLRPGRQLKNILLGSTALVVALSAWLTAFTSNAQAAACPAPTTDLGSTTMTISVPTTGTYRVWSRVMAPDTTNNSYSLDVDGANCYVVGDGQMAASAWTWVDYRDGTTASKLDLTLSAGSHTFKAVGREASVKLDRIILAADTGCIPVDTGNNCIVNIDQTPPVAKFTAPLGNTTVSGTVNLEATATDESGIAKVEFYVDNVLKATPTSAPYVYSWDSTTAVNGAHTLTVKASDKVGNIGTDSVVVTVKNGDSTPPSKPANLSASATEPTVVNLTWAAATDNVAVTGYYVQRNNVTIAQIGALTAYKDSTAIAATTYSYKVIAFDAAGNLSSTSDAASVTTPQPPVRDTQAPSVPAGLTATVAGASQINLQWRASADNVGVAKYNVYRSVNGGSATKIASVTTTSFGDSGLQARTTYKYYVTAEDAGGNVSAASNTVKATTGRASVKKLGSISGKVTSTSRESLSGAHVSLTVNGSKRLYHTTSNGSYKVPRLPAGTYIVQYATHDNDFTPQTFSLTVGEGKAVVKNVSLRNR